jgi:hypothetical protein
MIEIVFLSTAIASEKLYRFDLHKPAVLRALGPPLFMCQYLGTSLNA